VWIAKKHIHGCVLAKPFKYYLTWLHKFENFFSHIGPQRKLLIKYYAVSLTTQCTPFGPSMAGINILFLVLPLLIIVSDALHACSSLL